MGNFAVEFPVLLQEFYWETSVYLLPFLDWRIEIRPSLHHGGNGTGEYIESFLALLWNPQFAWLSLSGLQERRDAF